MLVYDMMDQNGSFVFSDEKFDRKWRELTEFFSAETLSSKLIAPLPFLIAPFPIRLNDELALDQLTESEVTQCCNVGVLRPPSRRFAVILRNAAVGIRRTTFSRKLIGTSEEPTLPPTSAATDEGRFGNRPTIRDDLVVDDVLSALRLFKHIGVSCAGSVQWSETFPSTGVRYRVLRSTPLGGRFELSAAEVPEFLDLWRLLGAGAGRLGFIIHRFNLAFERGLLVDRIVDLVIAAESLLLHYLTDRGDLRFRFAVRAAKFIEHPHYSERDVFHVMRRAYDTRSAVVHGGSPSDVRLPDNPSATMPVFIDAVEELVRLGLRKALAMREALQLSSTEKYQAAFGRKVSSNENYHFAL